jgi:hypothetical protein
VPSHYPVKKPSPHLLAQLLQQACKQFISLLLVLPPEIVIEIGNSNVYLTPESRSQIIDSDRSKDCLSCSRNPGTKQRLLWCLQPCLIFFRINNPLSSPPFSLINEIVLLRSIIDGSNPLENRFPLFAILSVILEPKRAIHSHLRCERGLTKDV